MNRSPAGRGPGRGTPRSRTTARPGERTHRDRRGARVEPDDAVEVEAEPTLPPRPRGGGITWRLVVLGVVFLGLALVLAQSLRIYFVQAGQLAELRAEIAATEAEILDQRDQLERWKDPDYVRSQARVRLGWVMPGEVGYRVIGADGLPIDGSETVGETDQDEPTGPWYERMITTIQVADAPAPEPEAEHEPDPEPDDRIIGTESPSPSPTDEETPS